MTHAATLSSPRKRPEGNKGGAVVQRVLPIMGISCANCAATIERALRKLSGRTVPEYDIDRSFDEYLVPNIRQRYKG